MKKLNSPGFAAIEALLVVIILGLVGFTGWFVWHSKQVSDKTLTDASKSQPTTAAKKSSNTVKKPAASDETSSWLLYSPPSKNYTVQLADGWKLSRYQTADNLFTFNAADLNPSPGTKAIVATETLGKDGGAVGFFLNYFAADQRLTPYSTQLPTFKTEDGVTVSAYTETSTADPDGLGGLPKGATGYEYILRPASGALIDVTYGFKPGDTDNHSLVEKAIKTIHFN